MEHIIRSGPTSALLRAVTSIFSTSDLTSETNLNAYTNLTTDYTNAITFDTRKFNPTVSFTPSPTQQPFTSAHLTEEDFLDSDDSSLDFISYDDDDAATLLLEHTVCCSILIAIGAIQYMVLGTLRVAERQHLRETFWDFFIQKSLFVFFILDAKSHQERSSWAIWFTVLGSIILLSRLCRDRFEYLTSSPATKKWPLIKISALMTFLLVTALFCNIIIPITDLSTHTLFLLADASYVLTFVVSVITRIILLTHDMRPDSILENSASISYHSDLFFSMAMLSIELFHNMHLMIVSSAMMIRVLCFTKIHTLLMEIRRRYRRHKHYLIVMQLMESNFANATKEEIEKFSDECAICWDSMDCARKLPCGHLFHNSCLRSWLEQDTSCPTCRTSFKGQQRQQHDDLNELEDESESESEEELIETVRPHQRNHLFHFDSSRYTNYPFLNWLPTISIEGFI